MKFPGHNSRINKKVMKKWSVIDANKYPISGEVKIKNEEIDPIFHYLIGYKKNDIFCFYFKWGCCKFYPSRLGLKMLKLDYFCVINNIEEHLKKIKYVGKVGFECCELEQLNRISEMFINIYGYKTQKVNGFIYVDFDWKNVRMDKNIESFLISSRNH